MTFQGVVLLLGYLASALVFATFFMRSRARLRQVAIASNVAFITYGIVGNVIPVLTLHVLLLPLNIWRLWEIGETRKAIAAAIQGDLQVDWLAPFGSSIALCRGERLFAQGDVGGSIYFILAGTLQLVESGILLGPGSLVGEMAIFSPQGRRTQGAVASSDIRLLAMSQEELLTLYRRHPEFGVYLLRLVTGRLLENNVRLQAVKGQDNIRAAVDVAVSLNAVHQPEEAATTS
jgi:CRP/FNR family transcriptional regulator, cyclic AMP receptor protein